MNGDVSNRDETTLIPISSKSVVIVAGSSFSLPVSVYRTNCVIHWEFESVKYDVLFGILKVDEMGENGSYNPILPLSQYSPDEVHCGKLAIEEPGRYVLLWDNTHSWLREKSVNLKVEMTQGTRTMNEIVDYSKWVCWDSLIIGGCGIIVCLKCKLLVH